MSTATRDIWYPLLHNYISSASVLHDIIPDLAVSPGRRLCDHPTQTTEHLLAECPLVWRVWTLTFPLWLSQPPKSPSTLIHALYTLDLHPSSPSIDSYHVLDGVLAEVWKAYWRRVFDDIPFTSVHTPTSSS
ncbi:hypothetical protein CLU79DRAFT_867483 [Phycomyces nitens]|nr:hypothetical protein CLU79DRAFT_867483 [Phycomyces nitens]